jgi:hypothetical protein
MPDHRVAHSLADHEPDAGRRSGRRIVHAGAGRRGQNRGTGRSRGVDLRRTRGSDAPGLVRYEDMHYDQCAPSSASMPEHRGEIVPVGQPGSCRKHRVSRPVRRTASPGPCGGARPGSPGRRGSASGAGNRGCANDGGCSAERCACPCSLRVLPFNGELVCAYAVVRRTTPVTPGKSDRMTACHSAPARGAVTPRVRSTLSGGQTGWYSTGGCDHRDPRGPRTPRDPRATSRRAHRQHLGMAELAACGRMATLLACPPSCFDPGEVAATGRFGGRGCPDTSASSPRSVPRTGVDNPVDGTADIGV